MNFWVSLKATNIPQAFLTVTYNTNFGWIKGISMKSQEIFTLRPVLHFIYQEELVEPDH